MWARKFERCIKCGTTKIRHIARGFCANCYQKDIEKRHKDHPRGLRIAAKKLTKQYITQSIIIVYMVFKLNGCIFILTLIKPKRIKLNRNTESAVAIAAPLIP